MRDTARSLLQFKSARIPSEVIRGDCRGRRTPGQLAVVQHIALPLPVIRDLRAREHFVEHATASLKLAHHLGLHQLTSPEYGSAPISRSRNDFLHVAKATKPRAADAARAIVASGFKMELHQLITSHLQAMNAV